MKVFLDKPRSEREENYHAYINEDELKKMLKEGVKGRVYKKDYDKRVIDSGLELRILVDEDAFGFAELKDKVMKITGFHYRMLCNNEWINTPYDYPVSSVTIKVGGWPY